MVFLKWLGRLILCACSIVAAWGAWYVIYQQSLVSIQEEEKHREKPPLAVEAVSAREDELDEQIVLVGNLVPIAQTDVRTLVDGYIKTLPYDTGDRVEVGDKLCQLDDTNHRELIAQAQAKLDVAEAQLAVQNSELNSSKGILDREIMLNQIGAGLQEALETAKADYEVALARQKLEISKVAEVKATLEGLEKQLKDFELISPIAGYVAQRTADIGDLAKSDLPLMQIVNLDKVLTTVHIIEKNYQKVTLGQSAVVSVDAFPLASFQGEVTRIAPTLDQETRTASVQIEVGNSQQKLKPGMYARVSLNPEIKKRVVLVPMAAILEANGKSYAYLVNKENQTEFRELRLGTSDGNVVEVVEGLQSGDKVITLGNRLVKPGQSVVVQEVPWSMIRISSANLPEESISDEPSVPLAGD